MFSMVTLGHAYWLKFSRTNSRISMKDLRPVGGDGGVTSMSSMLSSLETGVRGVFGVLGVLVSMGVGATESGSLSSPGANTSFSSFLFLFTGLGMIVKMNLNREVRCDGVRGAYLRNFMALTNSTACNCTNFTRSLYISLHALQNCGSFAIKSQKNARVTRPLGNSRLSARYAVTNIGIPMGTSLVGRDAPHLPSHKTSPGTGVLRLPLAPPLAQMSK